MNFPSLHHGRIAAINEPTTVVAFSGWPTVVHKNFPDDLAYHIAGVLEKIREDIPYHAMETPSMKQLSAQTRKPVRWIFRSIQARRDTIGRRGAF